MGFSRQEYWSGLPFASPEDLPDPGIKLRSPALQAESSPSEPQGNPTEYILKCRIKFRYSLWFFKAGTSISFCMEYDIGHNKDEHSFILNVTYLRILENTDLSYIIGYKISFQNKLFFSLSFFLAKHLMGFQLPNQGLNPGLWQ